MSSESDLKARIKRLTDMTRSSSLSNTSISRPSGGITSAPFPSERRPTYTPATQTKPVSYPTGGITSSYFPSETRSTKASYPSETRSTKAPYPTGGITSTPFPSESRSIFPKDKFESVMQGPSTGGYFGSRPSGGITSAPFPSERRSTYTPAKPSWLAGKFM